MQKGYGWGVRNQRVNLLTTLNHARNQRLILGCMTSLTGEAPVIVEIRTGNTASDFFMNFLWLILAGHLVPGDIFILDNYNIHFALVNFRAIIDLCEYFHITFRFLPCYSPELNPVELVFSIVKRIVRIRRRLNYDLRSEIEYALSTVTFEHIQSFYSHCVTHCFSRLLWSACVKKNTPFTVNIFFFKNWI